MEFGLSGLRENVLSGVYDCRHYMLIEAMKKNKDIEGKNVKAISYVPWNSFKCN